ncbi:MAG: RNA polymerase subunit sigma, partial [Myxococcales bacterium]|nr:RNA polymerase subunit sigma [Myxococcales bacterium]
MNAPPVDAGVALTPQVYAELRALAARYFRGRGAHTLQPTALVNEAYLKLDRAGTVARDREHFFAIAATAMRQILTDHA